jgi:acetyl esterase
VKLIPVVVSGGALALLLTSFAFAQSNDRSDKNERNDKKNERSERDDNKPIHEVVRLDPQMQQVVTAFQKLKPKPLQTLKADEARKQPTFRDAVEQVAKDRDQRLQKEKVAKVGDRKINGADNKKLDARISSPTDDENIRLPAIVYFHGGGFVLGDLDTYDASARALANQANAVVISVQVRQAPESRFPAAHDDALAAYRWVVLNANDLHIRPDRLAVAGESAGANRATSVAMATKNDQHAPVFQLLVYPFVSNDLTTTSHRKYGNGQFLVSNDALAWFWKQELGNDYQQSRDPRVLPIYAKADELKGEAPAMIILAEVDPLLDEDLTFAHHLREAGVQTDVKRYEGVTHELFGMGAVVDKAKLAQADAGRALREAFEKQRPTRASQR